jgi:hypothetical protein
MREHGFVFDMEKNRLGVARAQCARKAKKHIVSTKMTVNQYLDKLLENFGF